LAADGAGNLHLVWPGFHGGLYYRRWTPAEGWRETVQLGSEGCEAEIAINRSGLARVVSGCWYGIFFYEQTPDSGWLAAYQVADQGRPLDLAVDKDDRVHIVYEKENDLFYITLATRQSGQ